MHNLIKFVQDIAAPIGRVMMSIMFITAGWSKISGYAGTSGYMEAMGVPSALLPLVILLELGGGIMLLAGFHTRLVAFLLGGFTLIAAILFHYIPAQGMDPEAAGVQMLMFMKNLTIAGGFGVLVSHGGGRYSIDAMRQGAPSLRV